MMAWKPNTPATIFDRNRKVATSVISLMVIPVTSSIATIGPAVASVIPTAPSTIVILISILVINSH